MPGGQIRDPLKLRYSLWDRLPACSTHGIYGALGVDSRRNQQSSSDEARTSDAPAAMDSNVLARVAIGHDLR
jgi:hypothetical protein